jgi:hypothetical protein
MRVESQLVGPPVTPMDAASGERGSLRYRSPALADRTGRRWMVLMISLLSIPSKEMLVMPRLACPT